MMTNDLYANRLQNILPKIGIRPAVDGRMGGLRETLEVQAMNMARAAAGLYARTLRYANGMPVECVIADRCIGGVAEAAQCAEKFSREGVGVTLTVSPCWCYGSETMDMDPLTIKAIWGFNGTERPGAIFLAAVLAAHNQKGLPAFGIYGRDVRDTDEIAGTGRSISGDAGTDAGAGKGSGSAAGTGNAGIARDAEAAGSRVDMYIPDDVREKLLQFARAGIAAASMKGRSYLAMGTVSMGIAGSYISEDFFRSYLGMRNEYIDMSEFIRRIDSKIFDGEEYAKAIKWVRDNCREGIDYNDPQLRKTRAALDRDWEFAVKMAIVSRDLMIGNPYLEELGFPEEALGHNAIAAGFQGQRHWTDKYPNGDFMESILCSSFDWNGTREPFILATENDSLNAVSMLFGHLLSNAAQVFADIRTYWSPKAIKRVTGKTLDGIAANGLIHLLNSGPAALDGTGEQTRDGRPAMKPFWEISQEEVQNCLKSTLWHPANLKGFRGGGFSSDFLTKGDMPVTLIRLNLVKSLGPVLHIAEGYTVDIGNKMHDILDKRTNPNWPSTWFVPILTGRDAFRDVYSVMDSWGANHGSLSYGHIGADLITLASMLRIPVAMHNVPEEKIMRPSAWKEFGTKDHEAADYRACRCFGPLYG